MVIERIFVEMISQRFVFFFSFSRKKATDTGIFKMLSQRKISESPQAFQTAVKLTKKL